MRNWSFKKKVCVRCGKAFQPLSGNTKNCPDCRPNGRPIMTDEQKKRQAQYDKEYQSSNEYKDRSARAARVRRADPANKEKFSEQRRARRTTERFKKTYVASRGKRQVSCEKRRALKYGETPIAELLTEAQWRDILDQYRHRCAYCGKKMNKLTIDHIVPISKGGKHSANNVVPACLRCNCAKGTKTTEEWVGLATEVKSC